MILFRLLRNNIFLISIFCLTSFSEKRDWSILNNSDSLTLFIDDRCAGSVFSKTNYDKNLEEISTEIRLSVDPSVNGMLLIEKRKYSVDGYLKDAYQEISSAMGTTSWQLNKIDNSLWECVTRTGSIAERSIETKVHGSLLMEYDLIKKIRNNTLEKGMIFSDTVFDLLSKKEFYLTVTCIQEPDIKEPYYHFNIRDNRQNKNELWIVDKAGKTIRQDIPPIFRALKKPCGDLKKTVKINELWEMFKVEGDLCFGSSLIRTKNNIPIDSSVNFLYTSFNGAYKLRERNSKDVFKTGEMEIDTSWTNASLTIQKNNSGIKKIAQKHGGKKGSRFISVENMTFYLYKNIEKRAVSTFSNAVETLEAGYGDCGEHAVLLAAALRAVDIPAKVVLGLVAIPGKEGYFYHAWVVVPVKGGVVFADAALGNFPASAGYIPLLIDPDGGGAADLISFVDNLTINCQN